MNQYYGAYPPQSLTPQQAAALGGWQNNQNLQQMQGMGIQNGYPQQFVQAIPGRMIHDIQEVRPNEVPNNGTVAIFPKDDMSCVYVKYLSNVGKIETMTFVPMAQTAENLPENGELAEIRDKLDEIKRLVQKKSRPYRKEPYKHGKEGLNHDPPAASPAPAPRAPSTGGKPTAAKQPDGTQRVVGNSKWRRCDG